MLMIEAVNSSDFSLRLSDSSNFSNSFINKSFWAFMLFNVKSFLFFYDYESLRKSS